jgi:hypothetical protein
MTTLFLLLFGLVILGLISDRLGGVTYVLVYTSVGSLPWCFAVAGSKLGQRWQQVGTHLHAYDLVVLAAIIALIGGFLHRHVQRPGLTADAASSRDTEPEDFATMGAR